MQRDRDGRGGGGRHSSGITGNESEGLFTSNFSGNFGGSGGGGRVHRGASGGRSDRRRGGAGGSGGGGRRVGGLRGTSANLPHTRTTGGDLDGDMDMGEKKKSL